MPRWIKLALGLLACGCGSRESTPPPAPSTRIAQARIPSPSTSTPPAPPTEPSLVSPPSPGRGAAPASGGWAATRFPIDVEAELERMRTARPRGIRPIGTTSLTFRVVFTDGSRCAYKPRRSRGINGWKAEIAAYRLSRLLGIGNVPPAVGRRFRRSEVERGLGERLAQVQSQIVWERSGDLRGAAIWWVPGLSPSGIDDWHTGSARGIGRWTRELRHDATIDEARRDWLSQISTLLVFDYLIGNGDRWSGANTGMDETGSILVYRDHDNAFGSPLATNKRERIWGMLRRAERFSRLLVERMRAIDEAALVAVVSDDPEAGQALSTRQIREVLGRRDEVLRYVDGLVARHGEGAVLAFP